MFQRNNKNLTLKQLDTVTGGVRSRAYRTTEKQQTPVLKNITWLDRLNAYVYALAFSIGLLGMATICGVEAGIFNS